MVLFAKYIPENGDHVELLKEAFNAEAPEARESAARSYIETIDSERQAKRQRT